MTLRVLSFWDDWVVCRWLLSCTLIGFLSLALILRGIGENEVNMLIIGSLGFFVSYAPSYIRL